MFATVASIQIVNYFFLCVVILRPKGKFCLLTAGHTGIVTVGVLDVEPWVLFDLGKWKHDHLNMENPDQKLFELYKCCFPCEMIFQPLCTLVCLLIERVH